MNASIKLGLSTVALLVAGGLAAYAPTASAQIAPLKNTGFVNGCLTLSSTGAPVVQPCNGSSAQVWSQVPVGGLFQLRNPAKNACILVRTPTSIVTAPCDNTVAAQRFIRKNISATSYRFESTAFLGGHLQSTSTGSALVLAGFSTNPLQIWKL